MSNERAGKEREAVHHQSGGSAREDGAGVSTWGNGGTDARKPQKRLSSLLVFLFHAHVYSMRDTLDLLSFKWGADSAAFKFFRSKVMDACWKRLEQAVAKLVVSGILVQCPCGAYMKKGRTDCEACGGCGYKLHSDV